MGTTGHGVAKLVLSAVSSFVSRTSPFSFILVKCVYAKESRALYISKP
jgi:hypothetical protein